MVSKISIAADTIKFIISGLNSRLVALPAVEQLPLVAEQALPAVVAYWQRLES